MRAVSSYCQTPKKVTPSYCHELDSSNVTPANDTASPASYRLGMKSMRTGGVMNSRLTRRLAIALGLVLTLAALAAPSANAKMQRIYSDHGVALIPSSTELSPNLAYSDRGVAPISLTVGPGLMPMPQACSSQACTEISPPQNEPTPIPNVSDNPSGFDWSKTGFIVSLSMVGLLLLGGGALLAGRHNRRRRFAAA